MGYLEVRRKRDSDPNEIVIRAVVSDGDIERIYKAYAAIHFGDGIGQNKRPPTQQEVMQAAADSFVSIMIKNTLEWEKNQQAANLPPPAPIQITR